MPDVKTRIKQRVDTKAKWESAENGNFVPLEGEVIVYKKDGSTPAKVKIGDGSTKVSALPFITDVSSDASHDHDSRYYTETEINTKVEALESEIAAAKTTGPVTKVNNKTGDVTLTYSDVDAAKSDHTHNYAASSHSHDDKYYTETEINSKIETINASIADAKASGPVTSVNTKSGAVTLDYNDVGAASASHTHDYAASSHDHNSSYYGKTDVDSKVAAAAASGPVSSVNSKVGAVSLTYSDVGAAKSDHTHSTYVNQNAFSNVVVGSTTIAADSATDTLTLVAGSNVTLTPDATGDKITIAATDTNTHYVTGITAGASGTTTNAAATNPYVKIKDDSTHRSQIQIKGGGATTVSSDANGVITISSTDTDTHYTTGLKVGASASATANAAATNGNVYLNVLDNTTVRDSHKIVGSGATTVTSDANGVITISSTDNNTTYTSLKNPYSLTVQGNGTKSFDYDGSVAKTLNIKPGNNVSVSSDTNGNITISATDTNTVYTHPSYTARTGVPAANATLSFGGTFDVSQPVSDATGHITAINSRTYTMPSDRLFNTLVPTGTEITSGADLNTTTYLKVGRYFCGSNAIVKTLKNCPLTILNSSGTVTNGHAFMMQVYSPLSTTIDNESTGTWVYRIRKILHYSTGVEYTQQCYAGGTANVWTYGDWYATPRTKHTLQPTTSAVGSSTAPVYVADDGTLTACTYTLGASVPSGAKFTDTVYTHPTTTDVTGVPTANATPAFGGTFSVNQVSRDTLGHVSAITSRTVTIPSTLSNGTSTAGLIKTTSTVTSSSGYTACPVINGVPYYKDTDTDTNTDEKVKNTLATTTKAYITGTSTASTNTGGLVFDTGVYLDTAAGSLTTRLLNAGESVGIGKVVLSYDSTNNALKISF